MTNALQTSNIANLIEKRRDTLTALLPDRSQQDRFMAALLTYVGPERSLHAPALQESLVIALYQVAKLGLDPGVDCYLIPRSGKVRCELGFKGAVKVMLRTPGASHVHTYLIYEHEHYVMSKGRVTEHRAILGPSRGELVAAVAELHMRDGSVIERIVDQSEIDAAAAKGQAAWKTNASEMWRKTALLRLAKIVPLDSQTAGALADIERGTYDVTPMETTQTPARRFAPTQPTRMTLPAAPAAIETAPADTTEEADPWHE